MKGRRSSQSDLRRAEEWLNITVATRQDPNVSPLQPSLQSPDFDTLVNTSVVVFGLCCGVTESGSMIATEWQDYAQISTNGRRLPAKRG